MSFLFTFVLVRRPAAIQRRYLFPSVVAAVAGGQGHQGIGLDWASPVSTLLRWFRRAEWRPGWRDYGFFGGERWWGAAGKRSDELLRRSGRQRGMQSILALAAIYGAVYARRYLAIACRPWAGIL